MPGTSTEAPGGGGGGTGGVGAAAHRIVRVRDPLPFSEIPTLADPARMTRGIQAMETVASRRPALAVPVLRHDSSFGDNDATTTRRAADAGHDRGTGMVAVGVRGMTRGVPAAAVAAADSGAASPTAATTGRSPAAAKATTRTPIAQVVRILRFRHAGVVTLSAARPNGARGGNANRAQDCRA